jgi:hypothetical protein
VDYASTIKQSLGTEGDLSYFALAYLVRLALGGAVIGGGVVDHVSQAKAEVAVTSAQNRFPGWQYSVIESNGVGLEFIALMSRNPKMRIVPKNTSDVSRGNKEDRQYKVLSTLLERGILRISDEDTPFLNTLREYLDNYPNIDRHSPQWDVADAVVWAVVGMPDLFAQARLSVDTPEQISTVKLVPKPNPFNSFAER